MAKYLCVMCGCEFRREKQSISHMNLFHDHVVIKKKLRGRIADFLLYFLSDGGVLKLFRLGGLIIIWHVIRNHFPEIEWSDMEIILIGISIGMIA